MKRSEVFNDLSINYFITNRFAKVIVVNVQSFFKSRNRATEAHPSFNGPERVSERSTLAKMQVDILWTTECSERLRASSLLILIRQQRNDLLC
jgi:hypothetical protein